jgi:acetyltransferase-like isoleucine patch superfamily enzyme
VRAIYLQGCGVRHGRSILRRPHWEPCLTPLVPRTRLPIAHLLIFGWMPSPLRRFAYRTFLGYRIGARVKFGIGCAVVGREVRIDDDVEIGLLAVVQGRHIGIGRHSSVGTMSYLSCERIEIGEDARIREQVFVGGPALPESLFKLGDRTIVLQNTNINPTKPVVIGDDSGIGGHCLIFTHGSWLNQLDGYPVTYEPVTIGNSVWLPWRVFVMPGSTIGDGSVIGANSLVSGDIPPSSLAVGSPAKVIRAAPQFPKVPDAAARAAMVAAMLVEFERYLAYEDVRVTAGEMREYRAAGKSYRLLHLTSDDGPSPALRAGDTVLSERPLAERRLAVFRESGVHWLDLAGRTRSRGGSPLTEELALFLGRYGIRLPRDR